MTAINRLADAVTETLDLDADERGDAARARWMAYLRGWAPDLPDLASARPRAMAALAPMASARGWRSAHDVALRVIKESEPRFTAHDGGRGAPMDCPYLEQYATPDGWRVDSSGVWMVDIERGDTQPCTRPLVIVGAGVDVATDRRYLRLAWQLPEGRWVVRDVPRGSALTAREIVALADEGAPVSSVSARMAVSWLSAFEAANAHITPIVRVVSAPGWYDVGEPEPTYMLGEAAIGPAPDGWSLRPASDGEAAWCRSIATSGTIAGWLDGWAIARRHPACAIAVYASIAPMLRGLCPAIPGGMIEWASRSSSGKSVALELGASCYGSPDGLVRRWDATGVGVEVGLALARDMALWLDDTKALLSGGAQRRTETGAATITAAIYLATGAKGRLRGSVDGLREQRSVRSWLLSTAETPSIDLSHDGGIRPRSLTITEIPLGEDAKVGERDAARIRAAIGQHHGHAARAVARWCAGEGRAAEVAETYQGHVTRLSGGSGIERRLAQLIAAIATAIDVAEWAGIPRCDECLPVAARAGAYSLAAADIHAAALRALWGMAQSQGRIMGFDGPNRQPSMGWVGEETTEGARLIMAQVRAMLGDLGYDPSEMIRAWDREGWLRRTRTGKIRTSGPVAGRSAEIIRLTPAGLAAAQGEAER